MILYDVVDSPAGPVTVEMEEGRVIAVTLGDRPRHTSRRGRLPDARRWLKDWQVAVVGDPAKVDLSLFR